MPNNRLVLFQVLIAVIFMSGFLMCHFGHREASASPDNFPREFPWKVFVDNQGGTFYALLTSYPGSNYVDPSTKVQLAELAIFGSAPSVSGRVGATTLALVPEDESDNPPAYSEGGYWREMSKDERKIFLAQRKGDSE